MLKILLVLAATLSTTAQADQTNHNPIQVRSNSTTGPVGYGPTQMRHAYGFDTIPGNGGGQTIAIVDAYGSPTIQSDLDAFSAKFGIPSTTVQIAYPQGKPRKTDGGWALETSLDVEWAHAIAPGATILLVVAKSAMTTDLLGAVDAAVAAGASQVSMSWGSNEYSSETASDPHFNVPGVSFFASSGDNGAGTLWPSVSPYVTAVGGTTLSLDATGNRTQPETAWSGSGGGISSYELEPAYQTPFINNGKRGAPDVSYNADPNTGVAVYDTTSYGGRKGWFEVGGTSAGAPQWAALMSLVNANRVTALGSATNTAIYSLGTNAADFVDITSGCNSTSHSSTTCAAVGYDYVTGLGSPAAGALVPALTAY
jgi:subtilase family serine protease